MIDGYRYRDYMEQRKQAVLTCNLVNGIGMNGNRLHVGDLIGYWIDGRIMDKYQWLEYVRAKAKQEKEVLSEGGE